MAETVQTIVDPEVELIRQESKPRGRGRVASVLGFLLLLILIAASIVGAHRWRETIKVKRVLVEGNRIVPAGEIVHRAKVKAGTLMYKVDLEAIRKEILSQLYIKTVNVVRELPDALRIVIQERQPIAALLHDRIVFLDDEGVLLPPYSSDALFDVPFIARPPELLQLSVGRPVENESILRAVAFARQARIFDQEVYHLISEIRIDQNGDLILYSSDAGVKILLGNRDEAKKLLILKTFWNQFVHQRGANQLRLVDLRYEDQVIARWKEDSKARSVALYH